ncbi:D-isomer specific 2-hydroxyacid dehydrogenase NAD-binding protein [Paenibacillus sp. FSL R7-269]|uniref:D-2-hydroxyacid dehydrogenase n=1 Tax=Paenibacillus sp. FSL R7-269 TaxID=1226755 RepID=UPI0003E20309|nr:D-2-hydroxyacid dehydrogenase [Paenibacillus sp. FSL R7-269]ETT35895.1 D-isomer specific 2-hydroxyacid dehydrogenase NAD-binding protein [Paenibacillus sp. FSL R7-269]
MKAVSLISMEASAETKLEKALGKYEMTFMGQHLAAESDILEAEIIFGWDEQWAEVILANPNLKWMQVWNAGVDSLPLERFGQNKVIVTNSGGASAKNMAEQILGYMIMHERSLHLAIRNQIKHSWQEHLNFGELSGRTIGIVGVGHIGSRLAKIAKALGMYTLGVRNSNKPDPSIDEMYGVEQLNNVLHRSDYIVNILPLTTKTAHLFDAQQFAAFKEGAFYINVGRGKTTNTLDLIEALQSGKLKGAALDVFETEPLPANHPLWDMENVILTPHIAGDTDRYNERMLELVLFNLNAFKEDTSSMKNVISSEKQY